MICYLPAPDWLYDSAYWRWFSDQHENKSLEIKPCSTYVAQVNEIKIVCDNVNLDSFQKYIDSLIDMGFHAVKSEKAFWTVQNKQTVQRFYDIWTMEKNGCMVEISYKNGEVTMLLGDPTVCIVPETLVPMLEEKKAAG